MGVKACKQCGYLTEDMETCPNCGSQEFTENYKGMLYVHEPEKSKLAQHRGYKVKGFYAVVFE